MLNKKNTEQNKHSQKILLFMIDKQIQSSVVWTVCQEVAVNVWTRNIWIQIIILTRYQYNFDFK